MRHTLLILFCALCAYAHADIIVLKTGKTVEGDILLQNEQVVIVRDRKGARFQYPMTDVQKVSTHDSSNPAANSSATGTISSEASSSASPRKAMFRFELAGGLGTIDKNVGGAVIADLLVGSRQIAGRELFIGGGLGYHGAFANISSNSKSYHFLPIQAVLRYTFLQGEHSPYVGAGLGYGIALSKDYVGGIYSGLDLGYRYRTPRRGKSICVGLFGTVQGCRTTAQTEADGQSYIQTRAGRIIGQAGVKISFGL